ncbi:response regulator transcription factor [uncultured Cocleimonas sp.]|uniref:response regulator transcription factor n=1 Tax=uncultured Cocleimonas sp. TaxID=1051587 RepID=UPI002628AC82|nr:response regulator [uncultured Cocleimonas sp.]
MSIEQTVYIVDDEEPVRKALSLLTKSDGLQSRSFENAQAFLDQLSEIGPGCLLLDVCMPDMSGLELQKILHEQSFDIPVIVLTGHADIPTAVRAMKGGATDFIEKPFDSEELLRRIHQCLNGEKERQKDIEWRMQAAQKMLTLTKRERQVMQGMVEGKRNKQIADALFISFRTVELHRSSLMHKLDAGSLSDVVRISILVDSDA